MKQQEIHAGPPREPIQPPSPLYLRSGYLSRVKGGTVIAGDVGDRDQHAARLASPDGYRPEPCERCQLRISAIVIAQIGHRDHSRRVGAERRA